jgi:serine/threonine-protein kinase
VIGKTLGHYEILEPLGAGGMGEVYLAADPRLGRKVAVKVLPAEYAADPERLARFRQEARAAAALNHPHIAAVFDIGSEGDVQYIVQEYLEGQTLGQRLERGAMPLDVALRLSVEVSEALVAAHKAGIVHRDLKPANVFITQEGHAKLLDFGLAKLTEVAAPAQTDLSISPTLLGTVAGQVMGTAGYMAPEQVRGEDADHRTDLFSFGALLYEMASGRRPFAGKSVHDTLHRITDEEPPPLAEANPSLPFELRRIVKKCLAKERDRRYQGAGDLVVDLRNLALDLETGTAPSETSESSESRDRWTPHQGLPWLHAVGVAVVLVIATFAATRLAWQSSASVPGVSRFQVELPPNTGISTANSGGIAISSEGRRIAFVGGDQLWLRRLDQFEAIAIPGTEGASSPFFSPGGEELGYWAGGRIWRVPVSGGTATPLGRTGVPQGVSWETDGYVYVGQGRGGILRLATTGGEEPEVVVPPEEGDVAVRPQLLPGGEWLLFTLQRNAPRGPNGRNEPQIVARSLVGGVVETVIQGARDARVVASGHILFARGQELLAQGFDAKRRQLRGAPAAIASGLIDNPATSGLFSVSDNGVLVYIPEQQRTTTRALVWVDPEGAEEKIDADPGAYFWLDISPFGDKVAVDRVDASGGDILIYNLNTGVFDRLTSRMKSLIAAWSPDAERLVYANATPGTGRDMYVVPADGGSEPSLFAEAQFRLYPASWAPDDRLVAVRVSAEGNRDLVSFAAPGAPAEVIVASEHLETRAQVSPDGSWLAYVSDHTGERQIFVRPFDRPGGRTPVSPSPADSPRWSPDGSAIYYTHAGSMWAVSLAFDPGVHVNQEPRRLFSTTKYYIGDSYEQGLSYDVHPQTGKFLMLERLEAPDSGSRWHFNVILNWLEDLE